MMDILTKTTIYPTILSVIIVWIAIFFIKRSPFLLGKIAAAKPSKVIFFILLLFVLSVFFALKRNGNVSQNVITYTIELLLSFAFVMACAITWGILDKIDAVRRWIGRKRSVSSYRGSEKQKTVSKRSSSSIVPVNKETSCKAPSLESECRKQSDEAPLERAVGSDLTNE